MSELAPAFTRDTDFGAAVKSTTAFKIASAGAATKTDAEVKIPTNLEWKEPVTVAEAAKPGGNRSILTFAPNTAEVKDGQVRKYPTDKARVKDGDGVDFKNDDGSTLVCRLDTIDAPEVAHMERGKPHQDFGERAKKTLKDLIAAGDVTVKVTTAKGRYDRTYCQIEVQGERVDQKMLQQGAAWLYREYGKTVDPGLEKLELDARMNKTGLWENPAAQDPYQFRKQNPGTK